MNKKQEKRNKIIYLLQKKHTNLKILGQLMFCFGAGQERQHKLLHNKTAL